MLKRYAPLLLLVLFSAVSLLAVGCSGDSDRIVSSGADSGGITIDADYDYGWTNYVYDDLDTDEPGDTVEDDYENDDGIIDLGGGDDENEVEQLDSDADSDPEV